MKKTYFLAFAAPNHVLTNDMQRVSLAHAHEVASEALCDFGALFRANFFNTCRNSREPTTTKQVTRLVTSRAQLVLTEV